MLEGKNVNLRIAEKEDLPAISKWINNPRFYGEYEALIQVSKADLEKQYDKLTVEKKWFVIEKEDGTFVGGISHFPTGSLLEIGCEMMPAERNKGYCTEAVEIMVDYMFLSKEIVRIQAQTDTRNVAAQRVLEKAGFKKEGTLRKSCFIRGEWRNSHLYSILREEWKEPNVLTKTTL